MNLFFKLLLWFLVTATLVFGVMFFITWTFQTEPMFSRVQRASRNQMIIYGGTASQIVNTEGEAGLRDFLSRLKNVEPPREVDLVAEDGNVWFGSDEELDDSRELISRTFDSDEANVDFSPNEKALGAAPVTFPDGRQYVLVLQWETPRAPSF